MTKSSLIGTTQKVRLLERLLFTIIQLMEQKNNRFVQALKELGSTALGFGKAQLILFGVNFVVVTIGMIIAGMKWWSPLIAVGISLFDLLPVIGSHRVCALGNHCADCEECTDGNHRWRDVHRHGRASYDPRPNHHVACLGGRAAALWRRGCHFGPCDCGGGKRAVSGILPEKKREEEAGKRDAGGCFDGHKIKRNEILTTHGRMPAA